MNPKTIFFGWEEMIVSLILFGMTYFQQGNIPGSVKIVN